MEESKQEQLQKIVIRISAKTYQLLDQVTAGIMGAAKFMHLDVRGPVRLPLKIMNINTGLAGKGTNLRGNLKLRVYNKIVEVFGSTASTEVVDQIVSGYNEWDVEIELLVVNLGGRRR